MISYNAMKNLFFIFFFLGTSIFGQRYIIKPLTFQEVKPIFAEIGNSLPTELKEINTQDQWSVWLTKSNAETRNRLELGDEDSIVNQFLFGTSFTVHPRLTEQDINRLSEETSKNPEKLYEEIIGKRLSDYVKVIVSQTNDERTRYARDYFKKKIKFNLDTDEGVIEIKKLVINSLVRAINEAKNYTSIIEQTRNNKDEEFLMRSTVYQSRGLSSDTSLKPNLAIENAIKDSKEKGFVKRVKSIAIVGPGLDFTDKDQGYDFYPPQSIQPFAIIDSLLKLKLVEKLNIRVDTYDLSPKVNSHIASLSRLSKRNIPYKIQLPLKSDINWSPDFLNYWSSFGNFIGNQTTPFGIPKNLRNLKLRAISITSTHLSKIKSFDTNIVVESPVLLEKDKYDLVIGTNIFVYYSELEKALIMKNIDKMLRKGGLLLSNDALTEISATKLRKIGQTETFYSDKKVDGDLVIWYQKQ
jgi:hypothetical protein